MMKASLIDVPVLLSLFDNDNVTKDKNDPVFKSSVFCIYRYKIICRKSS